jgi:hypothetical protein
LNVDRAVFASYGWPEGIDDGGMAQKIEVNWDRFVDLTLREAGIQA